MKGQGSLFRHRQTRWLRIRRELRKREAEKRFERSYSRLLIEVPAKPTEQPSK